MIYHKSAYLIAQHYFCKPLRTRFCSLGVPGSCVHIGWMMINRLLQALPPQGPLIVGGATASGKSQLVLELAVRLKGAVINADSIQLYKGLPLLTAQPSTADFQVAPHFLYEIFDLDVPVCSAMDWGMRAAGLIDSLIAQGLRPLIVGGTGFYLKTLLNGLPDIPPVPEALKDQLNATSLANLYRLLQKADPLLAARLGPHDRARIVRAVGVWQASGKPLSFWQTQPLKRPSPHTFHTLCLMPSEGEGGRQWLKCRIARRFGQMMAEGALEEVRQLKSHLSLLEDLPPPPITRALGFQELSLLLEGQSTQDEAVNHAIIRSCQYAKRQCTWFRHQMPPHTSFIHPDQLILSP